MCARGWLSATIKRNRINPAFWMNGRARVAVVFRKLVSLFCRPCVFPRLAVAVPRSYAPARSLVLPSPVVPGSRTKVEEDNEAALAFYRGKSFKKLFVDKAARRYDTSGFLLQNVRTSKLTMRKVNRAGSVENTVLLIRGVYCVLFLRLVQCLRAYVVFVATSTDHVANG